VNISEAIEILSKSELKQLSLSDDRKAIIGYINMAITVLHNRFDLWEETAVVTMVDGVKKYTIDEQDINVTLDNTDHEFVMINSIFDKEDEKIEISIKESDYKGISKLPRYGKVEVPRYNTIKIETPVAGDTLKVNYKAAPKFLTFEKESIPLPPQYFEALFHYVGYRAHASVNGDIKAENNTHFMRFEQSCNLIKSQGLNNEDSMEVFKLESRGFV
jgi:hypothetical protein